MKRLIRAALMLLVAIFVAFNQAYAQSTPSSPSATQVYQAKIDIQNLVAQWRGTNAKEAFTSANMHRYILAQRQSKQAGGAKYPSLGTSSYQPLDILSNGSWVMGFITMPSGSVAALVDVNNTLLPTARESNSKTGVKILVLDNSGQVTQVLN